MMTKEQLANPSKSSLFLIAAIATLVTFASGLVYGSWTQRWGRAPSLDAAAKRVEELPSQLGPWHLQKELPMAKEVVEMLECAGYANRVYEHQGNGAIVNVALIVGPPGPTAVHTPEICYSSKAYEIAEPREKRFFKTSKGGVHSLWSTTFKSPTVSADELRVYYGWSEGQQWTASQSPRFEFGGSPLLYKIQVASIAGSADGEKTSDSCQDFINSLLRTYW